MFYRQSMLFVSFMKGYDKEAFKNLILNMYKGQTFAKSYQYAYNISIEQMWHMFTNQLKENKGGR